jgi:hypothetical protein
MRYEQCPCCGQQVLIRRSIDGSTRFQIHERDNGVWCFGSWKRWMSVREIVVEVGA